MMFLNDILGAFVDFVGSDYGVLYFVAGSSCGLLYLAGNLLMFYRKGR